MVLPRYDKTGSGSISSYEVKEMMVALGYQAEEKYLTGLLELFGARSSASGASLRCVVAGGDNIRAPCEVHDQNVKMRSPSDDR